LKAIRADGKLIEKRNTVANCILCVYLLRLPLNIIRKFLVVIVQSSVVSVSSYIARSVTSFPVNFAKHDANILLSGALNAVLKSITGVPREKVGRGMQP